MRTRLAGRRAAELRRPRRGRHLSAADDLGDVTWNEDEAVKNWCARVKPRPSFRPMLADTIASLPASETYANLDF